MIRLLYNDSKDDLTIRFTLAHELGYYILGHIVDNDVARKEADCFARNSLCPIPIVKEIGATATNDYVNAFYVSEPMASVSLLFQESDYYYIRSDLYRRVGDLFYRYMTRATLSEMYG